MGEQSKILFEVELIVHDELEKFIVRMRQGGHQWSVERSRAQCMEFLHKSFAEFVDLQSSTSIANADSLTPQSFRDFLESTFGKSEDSMKNAALFSFLQELNETSWFIRSHIHSLEAKIENLSKVLSSYETKFQQLDKLQSLLSALQSDSTSLRAPLQIATAIESTELDDELLDKALSKESSSGSVQSFSDGCFSLEADKKKWEEVSLSREDTGQSSGSIPADDADAAVDDTLLLNSFFSADYLLSTSSESSCPLDNVPEPALQALFREVDAMLKSIQPHESQLQFRGAVASFLRKQVRVALGSLAFETGLHAMHCFLPSDAVKLTLPLTPQQLTYWQNSLAERLKNLSSGSSGGSGTARSNGGGAVSGKSGSSSSSSLDLGLCDGEDEALCEHFQAHLRNIQIAVNEQSVAVHASSSSSAAHPNTLALVQFQIEGVDCQVSANQRLELVNLAFLQEFASLVGKDQLFKRSLLLVRSWWDYESSSYAGVMMKSALPEQTLALMLASVFNNYHHSITHPFEAFVLFLREFASFDGRAQAITMQGIVPFQSIAGGAAQELGESRENVPCLVKPQPHQLVSHEMLEKYWQMFCVHEAASALSLSPSPSTATAASANVATAAPASSLVAQMKVRQAMLLSMHRALAGFERNAHFNIVHPFVFCNLVVDNNVNNSNINSNNNNSSNAAAAAQSHTRRLALLPRVLQASYSAVSSLLDQCRAQYLLHHAAEALDTSALDAAANELLRRLLPSVYPRLTSAFRPDALNGSILLPDGSCGSNAKEFSDEARHRELLDCGSDKLWDHVAYCNFIAENVLTESAILTFCADTLTVKGPLPAGELGKLLSEASSIVNLSHKLREKFGGLKKFLERFPEKFIFSNDHPFNPHVLLRSTMSKENLELIDRGIFPIHLISKSARAAAAQAAKKKSTAAAGSGSGSGGNNTNINNNNNSNTSGVGSGVGACPPAMVLSTLPSTTTTAASPQTACKSMSLSPSSPAAPYTTLSAPSEFHPQHPQHHPQHPLHHSQHPLHHPQHPQHPLGGGGAYSNAAAAAAHSKTLLQHSAREREREKMQFANYYAQQQQQTQQRSLSHGYGDPFSSSSLFHNSNNNGNGGVGRERFDRGAGAANFRGNGSNSISSAAHLSASRLRSNNNNSGGGREGSSGTVGAGDAYYGASGSFSPRFGSGVGSGGGDAVRAGGGSSGGFSLSPHGGYGSSSFGGEVAQCMDDFSFSFNALGGGALSGNGQPGPASGNSGAAAAAAAVSAKEFFVVDRESSSGSASSFRGRTSSSSSAAPAGAMGLKMNDDGALFLSDFPSSSAHNSSGNNNNQMGQSFNAFRFGPF